MGDTIIDVIREDGQSKTVRVIEGQIFVCKGCCCGNVENGHAEVPLDRFKQEWKARGIRKRIHLTISGCLGPCSVANVVLLVYGNESVWLHSINRDEDVVRIYDYIQELLDRQAFVPPSGPLLLKVFQRYEYDNARCADF